ncbi:DUF4238 domain-containing protein [Sphingomonas sp.]
MSDPKRHHYLPEFYQKPWMGDDNKVTVYRRRYAGKLDIQRKARKAVGWETELYSDLSEQEPGRRQRVERVFLKKVDDLASQALAEMLETGAPPVDKKRASAWARFLMSLLHRHPARIAALRQMVELKLDEIVASVRDDYPRLKGEDDPNTFEEYIAQSSNKLQDGALANLMPMIIDSKNVGNALMRMTWGVGILKRTRFKFVTSDRPLMTTNGLGLRESFLIVPISPYAYFIAATRAETIHTFRDANADDVVAGINHAVCLQAEHFVLSHNEGQTRFIENRLGGSHHHPIRRDQRGQIYWENPHTFDPWAK